MSETIEISSIDLRYEGHRLRSPQQERRLLASIAQRGIEEPLEGVEGEAGRILLNGFKRYRCARKLGLGLVPYRALGPDEASAIVALLRSGAQRALGILEEARFVDELQRLHHLSIDDIACELKRSKSWVRMRLGLIRHMPETIRTRVFGGALSPYTYMYTLRPLLRPGGEERRAVEAFVAAVSGKSLSTRDLDILARSYFRGGEALREEILGGNLSVVLQQVKSLKRAPEEGTSDFERALLSDLQRVQRAMGRVVLKHRDERLESRAFHAEVNLLAAGLLSRLAPFKAALRELHDRSRDA